MNKDYTIPALDRGLKILDYLISNNYTARYTELKNALGTITDASLNRLLKSLQCSGYITKTDPGQYEATAKVKQWGVVLSSHEAFLTNVNYYLKVVREETGESTAFALFAKDKIEIINSIIVPDSIHIMTKGRTLSFEDDHAASLAITEQFDDETLHWAIHSNVSKIPSTERYYTSLKKFKKNGYYFDEAAARPGISRMAVSIPLKCGCGALFICTTTQNLKENEADFAEILLKCQKEWLSS